jgi:chloramphenicol-sensitive protein RarD
MTARPDGERSALAAGLTCHFLWGLLPLLLRAAGDAGASAWEIVAARTIWSVPFALLLVALTGRLQPMRSVLSQKWALPLLLLSSTLIGVNWTLYVAAVQAHHTLQASFGYYINPLLNMAVGAVFFRERINGFGWAAVVLAVIGVSLQAVAVGGMPWISLTLALSFCAYGIVRRQVSVDAQTGLFVECMILVWPALAYVAWLSSQGGLAFGSDVKVTSLLILGGLATVVPLALFAYSTRRLPLSTVGFMQFIGPSVQFMVGVFAFGEQMTPLRLVSFGVIWTGAAVFVAGMWWSGRQAKLAAASVSAATASRTRAS